MKKDFKQIAQETEANVSERFDMNSTETQELYEMFQRDPFSAISTCFYYGYAMGQRSKGE